MLVIVSGISGAGKSSVLNALEDAAIDVDSKFP